jgi:hypothetical protein
VLAACGGTSSSSAPLGPPLGPIPFALVSRAGTQPAAGLHTRRVCSSCRQTLELEPSTGPVASALSVVRPGEHVRIAAIAAAKPIRFITGFARKLCSTSLYFGKGSTLVGREWKVGLPPGRYVVNVSFLLPGRPETSEDGLVGLLVSRTKPLGIVRHPSC